MFPLINQLKRAEKNGKGEGRLGRLSLHLVEKTSGIIWRVAALWLASRNTQEFLMEPLPKPDGSKAKYINNDVVYVLLLP